MTQSIHEQWGLRKPGEMVRGKAVLIYGEPGRGKTTLIGTLKAPTLLITVDSGENVLPKCDWIDVFDITDNHKLDEQTRVARFTQMIDWLLSQKELPWKYIVIDNITELNNSSAESVRAKRGQSYPRLIDYRDTGIDLGRWIRKLKNLTYKNVSIILIAWEDIIKVDDAGGEVNSEKKPKLPNSQIQDVSGLMDFIMPLRVDKKQERFLQMDTDVKYLAKKRERPGQTLPQFIHCPKGEEDTLEKFFKLVDGEEKTNGSVLQSQD